MKNIFLLTVISMIASFSALAQTVVTAEKTEQDVDLCYYKQVKIGNYAFANLIGRCAWDPALNGMNLSLVSVSEDPMQPAHKIDLENVRAVSLVQQNEGQLQITVKVDDMDQDGNVSQKQKVIYVRSIDMEKGTFSKTTK